MAEKLNEARVNSRSLTKKLSDQRKLNHLEEWEGGENVTQTNEPTQRQKSRELQQKHESKDHSIILGRLV